MNPIKYVDRTLRIRSMDKMVEEGRLTKMSKDEFYSDEEMKQHILAGDIPVNIHGPVPDHIYRWAEEGKIDLHYDPLEDRSSFYELEEMLVALADSGNFYITNTLEHAPLLRVKASDLAESLSLPRKPVVPVPADKAMGLKDIIEEKSPDEIIDYLKN